ncbi:MAG: hypothetical protein C4518_17690 [Desulfobacteraceae bacterium]|nr:MAG: hypothetical protein C4518_17690 [Desulfobacteraceae bacterium]
MRFITFFFITAFLSVLGIVSAGQTIAKEAVAAPIAIVEQTAIEFSPVIAGTEVEHRFSVLNKGNAPLNIINVYSG